MFEKDIKEEAEKRCSKYFQENCYKENRWGDTHDLVVMYLDGYNKAKEEVKNDLMMKLKDEGIVKPLKDSILQNERLSSQEQQELCAWIECAMDFGENLDECAKELEEVSKANEWQYPSKGEYPKEYKDIWICFLTEEDMKDCVRGWYEYDFENDKHVFKYINDLETQYLETVIAWKEIVLPELKESE